MNLTDESENAGNVNLVSPENWEADLEATRKLGRYGTTTLRLYGRLYEDVVDTIPIGLDGGKSRQHRPRHRLRRRVEDDLQLRPMGWRGAKLDARFQAQKPASGTR